MRPTHHRQIGPLLTADEEQSLAARVHGGDPADALAARNELVVRNLPLAHLVARKKSTRWSRPVEDMAQDGVIGLMRAAELFEPGRGRFVTYALLWVLQAIRGGIADDNMIRPSRGAWNGMMRERAGRDVPAGQRDFVAACNRAVLCRATGWDHVESWTIDQIASPEHEAVWIDADAVNAAMERLPDRSRRVIRRRYFEGRLLHEIGADLGVTREWVRQLLLDAEAELRAMLAG